MKYTLRSKNIHYRQWLDDMSPFTVAISSLGEIFAVYVRETDFIPYAVISGQVTNENFRNSFGPESNPRKRKYEDKNYPLRSKI